VAVTHIADVTVAVEQSALRSSASRVTGVAIVPAVSRDEAVSDELVTLNRRAAARDHIPSTQHPAPPPLAHSALPKTLRQAQGSQVLTVVARVCVCVLDDRECSGKPGRTRVSSLRGRTSVLDDRECFRKPGISISFRISDSDAEYSRF
jgi:hypothetical protein